MKHWLILILILSLILSSCSPVRKEYFLGFKPLSRQVKLKDKKSDLLEYQPSEKPTFQKAKSKNVMDTTYIYYTSDDKYLPDPSEKSNDSESDYYSAMAEFDMEKYESACAKLRTILKNLNEQDRLFYEIKYQLCECEMLNEHFDAAEQMLNGFLSNGGLTDNIKQKAMVSLGQVYCLQNKTRLAEEMFDRLKSQYPESQYLPFANCESAGKH